MDIWVLLPETGNEALGFAELNSGRDIRSGGCAGFTQTDQEKVVDYAGMSCAELINESRTLVRQNRR